MPIYEYRSDGSSPCPICQSTFEVRQGIDDQPILECPECGGSVKRLFSRSFIATIDSLSSREMLGSYSSEEADNLGLSGGFAPDQIWE